MRRSKKVTLKYSKGELVAKKVLAECGLDDPTNYDLREIILGRKAFYREVPLNGKDGEIISYSGRSIIQVNSNIPYETRKRFAAAHELGHYEMHRKDAPVIFDTEEDMMNWYKAGPREEEANDFAAEFLMPSEIFFDECRKSKFSPKVIAHLSERFQTSKTATILKFVKRGNHPVVIVYCKDNKMKWWKPSVDFKYYLEFQRDAPPPTGSVAYEVFTKKKFYSDDELQQQIWKGDWLRLNKDETETPFFEYCLYVKSYNYTISIIWEN